MPAGTNPKGQVKWIVKDGEGKIFGPFSTEQVLAQIDRGYFQGGEQVASYPGGKWLAISKAPDFYDRLLDVLSSEAKQAAKQSAKANDEVTDPEVTEMITSPLSRIQPGEDEQEMPSIPESTQKSVAPPITNAASLARQNQAPLSIASNDVTQPLAQQTHGAVALGQGPVIELTDLKSIEAAEQARSSKVPLLFIMFAIVLACIALLLPDSAPEFKGARLRLLAPRKGQPPISSQVATEKYQRAIQSFQSDTFTGYQKAQNALVEAVEGGIEIQDPRLQKAEWLAALCLTYRELWAFSFQDATDMKTVSAVMQEAKRLDPGGRSGATCEIVQLLLAGRTRDAQGLTESMLGEESQTPVLFEIRGDIYAYVKDTNMAASYFNQARTLWPAWQKNSMQEARMRRDLKQYPQAIQLYRSVLQAVPHHAAAKIELGLIEALQFNHLDDAQGLFASGLDGKEKVTRPLESMGYYGLAVIAERRNQKAKALEYAKKAFETNAANVEAKTMVVRLGGEKDLKDTKIESSELMYLGEQYLRTGDYFAAQAEFKAAFEMEPKNGVAAMKAGQCLWQLNQTNEAIEWMRKAIIAEPQLTPAYVELADYYALRHDYSSAMQVLNKIRGLQPNSYEVYRGYATVELRRNDFAKAISYGQRAMKLYENDLQTFLLMSKAHIGTRTFEEAQRYAAKAIEMDFSSTEAHSLYGKSEAGLRGVASGAAYIQQMINRYVIVQGQQVPQAAIDFRVSLGEIYMQDEKYKLAEEAFRQAESLDKTNKSALINLGKALEAQGQQPQALEVFLRAAVLDPSDADPIYLSGQLYAAVGKSNEAVKQFERVLKINPRYPRAHAALGKMQLVLGDAKKAIEEAMAERAINPGLADSYLLAAEGYFALKQYNNCAAEYQQASRRSRSSTTLIRMARCYRLSGALDSAQSLLRQAQSLESGNPDLYKEQGAIFHMKGMADEAIAAYDTYLKLMPGAPDRAEIESRMRKVQAGDIEVGE